MKIFLLLSINLRRNIPCCKYININLLIRMIVFFQKNPLSIDDVFEKNKTFL